MRILRYLLAVAVGCIAVALTVGATEAARHSSHPASPELVAAYKEFGAASMANDPPRLAAARQAMGDIVAGLPVSDMVWVVVGWALAAMVGGALAALIAPGLRVLVALMIGALDALTVVMQCSMFPHPAWMLPTGVAGCLLGGAAAGLCIRRWRGRGQRDAVPAGS